MCFCAQEQKVKLMCLAVFELHSDQYFHHSIYTFFMNIIENVLVIASAAQKLLCISYSINYHKLFA